MQFICTTFQGLRSLEFQGCTNMTTATVRCIQRLPNLQSLGITQCPQLTDGDLDERQRQDVAYEVSCDLARMMSCDERHRMQPKRPAYAVDPLQPERIQG
jgi:hypothetical protein